MNVDRLVNGVVDPNEKLNKSQIYVTSAGYKATFAYEKLMQTYCQMVVRPKDAFVVGGDYRISVAEGLLSMDDVIEYKADSTYSDDDFDREYSSLWSGSVEGCFFDPDRFEKWRTLDLPDLKYDGRTKNGYYVMGVDVGRINCTTEVVILKVVPSKDSKVPFKYVENIFSFETEHFAMQAIKIKRIYERYKCKVCVLDANGLGIGLVDSLVLDQDDPDTGETLYNWAVMNPPEDDPHMYDKFETPDTLYDRLWLVKADRKFNSELYSYVQTQFMNGKVRFLKSYRDAETALMQLEKGKHMTHSQRENELMPFRQTDILKAQMMNMVRKDELGAIVLEQANRKMRKDKFSAFIYAMYWCKMEEERSVRKKVDMGDFVFFSKPSGQQSLYEIN